MENMGIPLDYVLIVAAVLFCVGVVGVLINRNIIMIFMSIELMLNAANITLVAFSSFWQNAAGQMLVLFSIAVAAAEAGIGLAIIISLYRGKQTLNIDEINIMKW